MSLLNRFSDLFKSKKENEKLKIRMKSLVASSLPTNIANKIEILPNTEQPTEWDSNIGGKTIKYPTKGKLAIENQKDYEIIGFLLHEIAHYNNTHIDPAKLPVDQPIENYTQTLNLFEDIRIEKKMMSKHRGTYDNLKKSNSIVQHSYDEDMIRKKMPNYAIFLNNFVRAEWGISPILNDDIRSAWEDKKIQRLVKELTEAKTTHEMISDYIFPKLWPTVKKLIEDEQQQEKGDNQSNGENDNAEKQPQKESPKEHDSIQSLLSSCIDEQKKEQLEQELEQPQQPQPQQQKAQTEEEEKEQAEAEPDYKAPNLENTKEDHIKTLKREEDPDGTINDSYLPRFLSYEELYDMIEDYLLFFRKKLGSVLKDNRQKRSGGSFRSGKLNTKKLYKWKCDNTKIFSKTIVRSHKDYNIALVVDESGSMSGNRIINAAKTSVLLAEVLDFCKIPFCVYGFNEIVKTYKKVNEKYTWSKKRNLENIIPEACCFENSGATSDGAAINFAKHELDQYEGENIIFVVTDGESNPSGREIPDEHKKRLKGKYDYYDSFCTKTEIRNASKNALVVGVGIGDHYIHEYITKLYPLSIYVNENEIDTLPQKILQLLQRNIKRG